MATSPESPRPGPEQGGRPRPITTETALDVNESLHLPANAAMEAGDFVFTLGMWSIDPKTGASVEGDIVVQTTQVLENLKIVLKASNCTFEDVVMVHIFLAHMSDYEALNKIYYEYFPNPPARYCVGAALVFPYMRVEIHMIAKRRDVHGTTGHASPA
jgi:2-iminobutanoate/2-iminopropanoate deaminase